LAAGPHLPLDTPSTPLCPAGPHHPFSMTPDELSRELVDLDRFSPPSVDPAHLLALETRLSDLSQETTELRNALAQRDAKIVGLLNTVEQQNGDLLTLKTAQQDKEKQWEAALAAWRRKQEFWAPLAIRERADLRAKRNQWIQAAGLAVAGLAVSFGFWFAGQKYWTFTHDDQLRMLQTAARDKADALAAYQNAHKDLAEITRLRNQIRRAKRTTAATQTGGENAATDAASPSERH
jgi:hypothetical protein